MKYEKERLVEFGGHVVKLGCTWAESLLARMKSVQRKASTAKSKQSTADFEQLKSEFLRNVATIVFVENIKPDLIFNWDQMGACKNCSVFFLDIWKKKDGSMSRFLA